jgi:nucleoside-diphosphate-sugar epimerase
MTADAHGNLSGKRLVVFGCGYVGGALARQARGLGLTVAALTRNPAQAAALRADGIAAIEADLAGEAWHPLLPGGADFVVNCVSSGGLGLAGYRRSYVDGMRSILAWARREPVGTAVYTSSTSVYPQGDGARVEETASTDGAGETGKILLEAEALLRASSPACGRAFVLRLAGIYGPGRHRLLDQVRAGEVSGRAEDHLNLAHRDDICAAIWRALTAPPAHAGGIFNVADDAAATRAEITRWLADRLGVPPPRFSEAPPSGRRTVTPDRIIVNDRLKRELGWKPAFPSFREGYSAMLHESPK